MLTKWDKAIAAALTGGLSCLALLGLDVPGPLTDPAAISAISGLLAGFAAYQVRNK